MRSARSSVLLTRIIPTMLYRQGRLVKGKQWVNERTVGNLIATAEVHLMRDVDELLLLFLDGIDFDAVSKLGDICHVPLTVGPAKSLADVRRLTECAADKVVCSHAIVPEVAKTFGSSTVVVCVDFPHHSLDTAFRLAEDAGEVILQHRSRDGMMTGYDLANLKHLKDLPCSLVASSGCGTPQHMLEAIEAGASAVASGAMWQFTRTTPRECKRYLADHGVPVRL